jgi:hypothetical protein
MLAKNVMVLFLPFSVKCVDNVIILDDTNELWEVFHSVHVPGVVCTFHSYIWKYTTCPS